MFLLIDKEKGISSFKAINQFAKENNIRKIGHTGTLDPLATGLLLVATDDDTKLIDYIDKGSKKYIATMKIGSISDTYDIEGEVKEISTDIADPEKVKGILSSFEGEQQQLPPQFSAKKVNGQRAYKIARENGEVELRPVRVNISKIDVIKIEGNYVTFETVVSRGTYIRSIIHDFGQAIGMGAIMTELRRTEIGSLTEKEIGEVNIEPLFCFPVVEMTKEEIKKLANGLGIENNTKEEGKRIIKSNNVICGIAYFGKIVKSIKLFGNKIDTI